MKNKSKFWEAVKKIVLEILIIVFGITLSIWLDNRFELSKQREEVKVFLLGLKSDLLNDIEEMQADKESYQKTSAAFAYLSRLKMTERVDQDSFNRHSNWIFNTTGLVPNSGRFEGFKSSGKMGNIENKALQNDIMDLYQENIPMLLSSTNSYTAVKSKLFDFVFENTRRTTDSTTNMVEVLAMDQSINMCSRLRFVDEITSRYDTCIDKMKKIIAAIDETY